MAHLYLIGYGEIKNYKIDSNNVLTLQYTHCLIYADSENQVKLKAEELFGSAPVWLEKLPIGIVVYLKQ